MTLAIDGHQSNDCPIVMRPCCYLHLANGVQIGISYWLLGGILSTLCSLGAIAPPAGAETEQVNRILSSQGNQTFTALMQQAETLAGNAIQQEFARRSSITEVSLTIVGERNGQEVPILFSKVSRSEWQKQPRVQFWSQYLANSEALLGFLKPEVQSATVPSSNPLAVSVPDKEPNFYN